MLYSLILMHLSKTEAMMATAIGSRGTIRHVRKRYAGFLKMEK